MDCYKNAIPFSNLGDEEFHQLQFNSTFDCKCNQSSFMNLNLELITINMPTFESQTINLNPNEIHDPDTVALKTDFDYYDILSFHKKIKNVLPQKCFSLLHTNIQSLNCNFEKLEYLLYSLDFKFDIIGLTETWNPKTKCNFSPGLLLGYQPYFGTAGKSIKSGSGFYI